MGKKSPMSVESMDRQNSSTELIQREEIENTPFKVITIKGKSFGAFGNNRITEEYTTKEEVINQLKEPKWEIIITIILAIVANTEEIINLKKTIITEPQHY